MGFWFPQSAFESLYLNHKRSRSFWAGFTVTYWSNSHLRVFPLYLPHPHLFPQAQAVIYKSQRINNINKISLST